MIKLKSLLLITSLTFLLTPVKTLSQSFAEVPINNYNPAPYFSPINNTNVRLVLVLHQYKLYLYKDNKLTKVYPVAIGKKGWETPVGDHFIRDKIENPAWTNFKTGKVVPPGKSNPLGSRWIEWYKISNTKKDVIGFHGTNQLSSIGKSVTHGCVRMRDADVKELYNEVEIGTPVKVTR